MIFFFFFEKTSSSISVLLVMLLAHVGKRSQMFSKTGVLKNFAIFTRKNLCWSLFLIKFQDWRPTFLFKKRLQTPTQVFFCEYCEIFKNSFFIEDLLIIPFRNFYLIIHNWYFRVIFYYCKIRPSNRKNFAIDQSKLVFRYLIISLLQRFVSTSNCKEKLVALNWTILVSNLSKYI